MKILAFIFLVTLPCSCTTGVVSHTSNPADAYASAKVISKQDGSLIVSGPGDSINLPESFFYHPGHGLPKPSWVPPDSLLPSQMVAAAGLTAHVTGKKCAYACFTINRVNYDTVSGPAVVLQQVEFKDSKRTASSVGKKYIPYSRAALDKAANRNGLTVLFPEWSASHTFSAAYVSGFLRKVDEMMRMNPREGTD